MGKQMTEDLLMLSGMWLIAISFVLLLWAHITSAQSKKLSIAFVVAGILALVGGGALISPSSPFVFSARIASNDP